MFNYSYVMCDSYLPITQLTISASFPPSLVPSTATYICTDSPRRSIISKQTSIIAETDFNTIYRDCCTISWAWTQGR